MTLYLQTCYIADVTILIVLQVIAWSLKIALLSAHFIVWNLVVFGTFVV